jgi:predicted DNA-binding transcriptional regulator AlpA
VIEALTGVTAATIRADRSRGRWPAPDDTGGRAHRWYGKTVTTALTTRRGYHRSTEG